MFPAFKIKTAFISLQFLDVSNCMVCVVLTLDRLFTLLSFFSWAKYPSRGSNNRRKPLSKNISPRFFRLPSPQPWKHLLSASFHHLGICRWFQSRFTGDGAPERDARQFHGVSHLTQFILSLVYFFP